MGRKKTTCAYCGQLATTVDHIPPKGLYAKPLPVNLVTVPSCLSCDGEAAKDDEYFRTVMSFRHDTYHRPDAAGAAERAMRALVREGAEGFRKSFLGNLAPLPVLDNDGTQIGTIGELNVDMRRVRRVVERMVRGLYYHHKRERLPPECRVTVNSLESFDTSDAEAVKKLCLVTEWALAADQHALPRGVLNYRFRETPQDPACAVWVLGIYDAMPFIVVTAREQPAT